MTTTGEPQSQPVPAKVVVGGLIAVLIATGVGSRLLPEDGGKTVVAVTNGVTGLIAAAIGGYASNRAKGATQAAAHELRKLLKQDLGKET